jgi:ATP-dependent exoDNAse (exonuclease V) alpha subunit
LSDLLASDAVPSVRLTEIFRQAETSRIVRAAHDVRHGRVPEDAAEKNDSVFKDAFVNPKRIGWNAAGLPPSDSTLLFSSLN